jgi:hypothetical protein
MKYQPQTYNNCSHCSVAILLGYYDYWITQFQVDEDITFGYFPCTAVNYMPRYQLTGRVYTPLSTEPIRRLLANGIPAIVGQLLSLDDPIGHYRVARGYDDAAGEFIFDDPLQRMGPDYRIDYQTFGRLTRGGGLFIAIYPPVKDALVVSLMRGLNVREISCAPLRHSVALADLDADGDQDAFIDNWAWLNDGTGVFTHSGWGVQSSGDLPSLALGDLDGDGDVDAFTANWEMANAVWLNDGSGRFSDSGQELGRPNSTGVALGDLDGDGDLDAFVANYSASTVWLNDGAGVFTDSGRRLYGESMSVALGDVDGDGDLDGFVRGSLVSRVWLNDGTGIFTDSGQRLGSTVSSDVALGDLDGDGDLDVAVASLGDGDTVWLNDGTGIFADSGQRLGDSSDLALGDMDGDGDLDIVSITEDGGRIWLNDGTATFGDSGQSLGGGERAPIALGDLDGDGDLDALLVNSGTSHVVWLNETP